MIRASRCVESQSLESGNQACARVRTELQPSACPSGASSLAACAHPSVQVWVCSLPDRLNAMSSTAEISRRGISPAAPGIVLATAVSDRGRLQVEASRIRHQCFRVFCVVAVFALWGYCLAYRQSPCRCLIRTTSSRLPVRRRPSRSILRLASYKTRCRQRRQSHLARGQVAGLL